MSKYQNLKKEVQNKLSVCFVHPLKSDVEIDHDLWKKFFDDKYASEQSFFLMSLNSSNIPVEERKLLLDEAAREYTKYDGWLAYINRHYKEA